MSRKRFEKLNSRQNRMVNISNRSMVETQTGKPNFRQDRLSDHTDVIVRQLNLIYKDSIRLLSDIKKEFKLIKGWIFMQASSLKK